MCAILIVEILHIPLRLSEYSTSMMKLTKGTSHHLPIPIPIPVPSN